MNKKMIVLTLGATLSAPVSAQTDITVYGSGQIEFASWSGDFVTGTQVSDNRGRIGVDATEDLGEGLTALFRAEFEADFSDGDSNAVSTSIPESIVGIDANGDGDLLDEIVLSNSTEALSKREMMIGLKGDFGEVNFGRIKQAYKYTGGREYDPFNATLHEARGTSMSGGALGHNSFLNDSVSYKNTFNQFTAWITYDLDNGGPSADDQDNSMTASLKFSGNNFEAFIKTATNNAEINKYTANSIGGQFKVSNVTISAQLENTEFGTTEMDYTFLGSQMQMGKSNLILQYGAQDRGLPDDTTKLTLGAIHKFSERTRAFAGYSNTDFGSTNRSVISVGMRVDI